MVVKPDVAVASKVTVGVRSNGGGVGAGGGVGVGVGVGVGGVGADGGAATAADPPPPPQPNSGAVMPKLKANKTSRRFALTAGAAGDSTSFEISFALIDFTPVVLLKISSFAGRILSRILAKGEIIFCGVS